MTKIVSVQLYGHPGNNAVIRMPGRQNAGVVVQADTLRTLAEDARELSDRLKSGKDLAETAADADAIAAQLEEMLAHLRSEMVAAGEQVKI